MFIHCVFKTGLGLIGYFSLEGILRFIMGLIKISDIYGRSLLLQLSDYGWKVRENVECDGKERSAKKSAFEHVQMQMIGVTWVCDAGIVGRLLQDVISLTLIKACQQFLSEESSEQAHKQPKLTVRVGHLWYQITQI